MARFQKEEHHCGPLSLGFPNWKENTAILDQKAHQATHQTLDIPHGLLRRFRKRTNHLSYWDTYFIDEMVKLQGLYFARMSFLPHALQVVHMEAMFNTWKRAEREYNIHLQWDEATGTITEQFNEYLRRYHAILYKIAARNESLLPPQFHPTS